MVERTPNLGLEEIAANTKVWADRMNNNLTLIDAAIGAYFTLQNLQGIWENSHAYIANQTVVDGVTAAVWTCQVDHTSLGLPSTFAEERAANPTYWTVYSSPARARGAWTGPGTSYGVNDFVVSGAKYAVCITAHTSSATFDIDETLGRWSVLVDLSSAGSSVLPTPGGLTDANKAVVTPPTGTGYTIVSMSDLLTLLGASTVGKAVFQAASAGAARAALDAQVSGSYQAGDATLSALSGQTTAAFGIALLALTNAVGLRAAAGLGTAAVLDAGTSVSNLVQMATGPKLPAVDGSALTNLTIPYPTLTSYTNTLGADVVCANTALYYDGPSLNLGTTGTWLVIAKVCVGLPGTPSSFYLKLTDGTTLIDTANLSVETSTLRAVTLAGIITNPAADVKAQVRNGTVTNGGFIYNNSGLGKDCQLFAVRIA